MAEKIAILASGEGTTAESFIRSTLSGEVAVEVGLVVSNNPRAGVLRRVERLNHQYNLNIATQHISSKTHPAGVGDTGEQTLAESEAILQRINEADIGLVLLLGYMKKVRGPLLESGPTILNTHPGPLPQTAGMYGLAIQEYVIQSRLGYSAQTLHRVAASYDTGHIVAEHRVAVPANATPQSLYEAVQSTEKYHLPHDVHDFCRQVD